MLGSKANNKTKLQNYICHVCVTLYSRCAYLVLLASCVFSVLLDSTRWCALQRRRFVYSKENHWDPLVFRHTQLAATKFDGKFVRKLHRANWNVCFLLFVLISTTIGRNWFSIQWKEGELESFVFGLVWCWMRWL